MIFSHGTTCTGTRSSHCLPAASTCCSRDLAASTTSRTSAILCRYCCKQYLFHDFYYICPAPLFTLPLPLPLQGPCRTVDGVTGKSSDNGTERRFFQVSAGEVFSTPKALLVWVLQLLSVSNGDYLMPLHPYPLQLKPKPNPKTNTHNIPEKSANG